MTHPKEPSTAFALTGLILFVISGLIFELILWERFGGEIAALPACLFFGTIGYRMCWVPASGSAGAGRERGNGTGAAYVVQLDPEDPDAGIPRPGA